MSSAAWPKKTLGEVVEFLDGRRIPLKDSDRAQMKGQIPYYGANGQIDSIDRHIFDEPLILLAEDGGHFGSKTKPIAYKVEGKSWVNNHAHVLRPINGLDIDFLKWSLAFYDVTKFTTGSTRIKLTKGDALKMQIPYPDLKTQRNIASILDQADTALQKRREASRLTEQFLQSAFLEMFGDPETNPKRWKTAAINDVIEYSEYGTSNKSNQDKDGYPVLGMSNITYDGRIDLTKLSHVELTDNEFAKLKLEKGHIIFNRTNSTELVGKTSYWNRDIDAVLASYLVKLKLKTTFNPICFSYLLNTDAYKKMFVRRCKKAVGQSNISPTLLKEFPIYLPELPLQQKFAALVEQVERLRARQRESERELERLFQSLMQKYFRS